MDSIYISILVMAATTYLIRVLPFTIFRKQIKQPFVQAFLYYVPYVSLALMTFPAILNVTQNLYSGIAAFVVGAFAAWMGADLLKTVITCCSSVFLIELFI